MVENIQYVRLIDDALKQKKSEKVAEFRSKHYKSILYCILGYY